MFLQILFTLKPVNSLENIHGTYHKMRILQRPTELWNGSHCEALHAHGLGMKKLTDCCGVGEWVGRGGKVMPEMLLVIYRKDRESEINHFGIEFG